MSDIWKELPSDDYEGLTWREAYADNDIIVMEQRETIKTFEDMIVELEKQNFTLTALVCPLDMVRTDEYGNVGCKKEE